MNLSLTQRLLHVAVAVAVAVQGSEKGRGVGCVDRTAFGDFLRGIRLAIQVETTP